MIPRRRNHILHFGLAAQVELDVGVAKQAVVAGHGLASVLVRLEGDERVASLASNYVHTAVRYEQTLEEPPYVN